MSRLEFSLPCAILCIAAMGSPALGQWASNGVPVATWTGLDERPASIAMTRTGRVVVAYREVDPGTWMSRGCYRELDGKGIPGRVLLPEGCEYLAKAVPDGADGVWGVGLRKTTRQPDRFAICPSRILNDSTLTSCDPSEWDAEWTQEDPDIAPDGKGGMLLVWSERADYWMETGFEIQGQRYDSSGEPRWGESGAVVCEEYGDQTVPRVVADGAEGAVAFWRDSWRGPGYGDLFAVRIDAEGHSMWGAGGVYLYADAGEAPFDVAPDGSGGAICVWCPRETDYPVEIAAQRIDGSGELVWAEGGETVGVGFVLIEPPQVVSDGAGGAIVAWRSVEDRTERTFAQRLDKNGNPVWGEYGVMISEALCPAPGFPVFEYAPPGGRIILWSGGGEEWEESDDATRPRSRRYHPGLRIVEDGSGGAIVGWVDGRGADPDIYAQRLDAKGDPQWQPSGVPVCKAAGIQDRLVAATDGESGVLFAWRDFRAGRLSRSRHDTGDLYALRITADGAVAGSGGR